MSLGKRSISDIVPRLVVVQVEHGAFTDIEDNDGETPLSYATTDELALILSNGKSQQAEE